VLFLISINTLVLLAFLLIEFPYSSTVFACNVVGAAIGVAILYTFGKGTHGVRITWLLASALLIAYCGGALNTQISMGLAGHDVFAVMGIELNYVAYAMVLVMLACAALLAAGIFEPAMISDRNIVNIGWKQERFLWIALAAVVIAYLHNDISYMGTTNEIGTGRITVLGSVANSLNIVMAPLAAIGIVQSEGTRRIRFIIIEAASLLTVFPFGRRALFDVLLVSLFAAARLSGWSSRMSLGRKALMTVVFIVGVSLSNIFFMGIRLAAWSLGDDEQGARRANMGTLLMSARMDSFTDPRGILDNLNDNIRERTFLIGYLSLLARGGNTPSPMWGSDAQHALQMATPDMIYSALGMDKAPARAVGVEEGVANEHFGLPVEDMANSILTGGIIDLGLLGIVAYPLILCALTRGLLHMSARFLNSEGQVVAILYILVMFLSTETEIGGYLVELRDLAILLVGWGLLNSLPGIGRRDQAVSDEQQPIPAGQ
jgi:hypothetical protein